MQYKNLVRGVFRARLNRFVARVEIGGEEQRVHVKNTGRCAELLVPGNTVYLVESGNPNRRTAYDLVAVERRAMEGTKLINMDSMAPNAMAREWMEAGALGAISGLRAEVRVGDSRFDFAGDQDGRRVLIEVKGCTLEADGIARFPDAPTLRGLKHVRELTRLAGEGCRCVVLIVIQMKGVHVFQPNWGTQPEFGEALIEAARAGVELIAVDCVVWPGGARIDAPVSIDLNPPSGG